MKKKLISLISAALCLCMVLSACGGPGQQRSVPLRIRQPKRRRHPRQNAYHRNHDRDNLSVPALHGCL